MITIEFDSQPVLDALRTLFERVESPKPALIEIGGYMANATKQRFRDGTAPDGSAWAPNSPATVEIYNGLFASAGAKRPLIGENRRLSNEISWQLQGDTAVDIGSAEPYANMQQFGGTKAQWPHLWGDIPARPFLGVSPADEENILDIVGRYLGT